MIFRNAYFDKNLSELSLQQVGITFELKPLSKMQKFQRAPRNEGRIVLVFLHKTRLEAIWTFFLCKRYETIARMRVVKRFGMHLGRTFRLSVFSRRVFRTCCWLSDAKTVAVSENPNAVVVFADFPALSLQTSSRCDLRNSRVLHQKMQSLAQMKRFRDYC